jgi:integrase
MARGINRLSGADLRRSEPGLYGDGNNLFLQVSLSKTNGKQINRSWIFRYTTSGRAVEMGLGSLNVLGLKEAREQAREYCALRLRGIDPLEHRDAQRAAAAAASMKSITFEAAAHAYIAAHRSTWRNEKHAQEWPSSLRRHVFPTLGSLPVAMIDNALVVKALEKVWQSAPETGARCRGRVEAILDWATVSGYRSGDNPARWNGHLEYLLATPRKRRVEHLAAMPWRDVPSFIQKKLRGTDSIAARALEFAILTAARTAEVRGAVWNEVDLDNGVWSLPGERTKSGREHRVPLSPRCMQILKEVRPFARQGQHVFPGIKGGLGESAFLKLLKLLGHADVTVHGFRSSFRDWAGEATNFPREVCEAALAHATGDRVEQAYRRGDALEKRRRLMTAWADYCSKPAPAGATVTPLRAHAGA